MVAGKRARPSAATPAGIAKDGAGPGPGSTASGIVALHRSRLFDWKPSAVVAIAPCPGAPLFAVGYESGSLELWDMLQLVCVQSVVGPCLELTSLAWARDAVDNTWRTFAAFMDGSVAEVLWRQAAVAHSMDSYGGVVWALAASPPDNVKPGFAHLLAAACDDGSVRLFGCEGGEPGLVPERVLARLEGRLLCCCWHAGGTMLAVAGSTGNIHLLDAVKGTEHLRITAAAATPRPVTVWRLLSLPDGTLVSGDSDGATQMWDGRFGTLLSRFTQHKADVLALAASEEGTTVFAAGVDSQVAMFNLVPGTSGAPASWVYTHYKRPHTHDVRSLAMLGLGPDRSPVLLSGGVDAQLIAYPAQTFLQEHPTRLCKSPQRPIFQASSPAAAVAAAGDAAGAAVTALAALGPVAPRLLVAQSDSLDVWQLATAAARSRGARLEEGDALELVSAPRHLARIRVKDTRVASASLSPSGSFVACTTPAGTRVYALEPSSAPAAAASGSVTVTRLRLPAAASDPGVAVAVTDSHLVLALQNGSLLSCDLPEGTVVARRQHPAAESSAGRTAAVASTSGGAGDAQAWRRFVAPAGTLTVSADGSLLAAVGPAGISLHRLPGLEPHGRVLRADSAITACAFSTDGRLVAATTTGCQLLVWTTSDCQQLRWAADNAEAITAAVSRLPGVPSCISFCPSGSSAAASPQDDVTAASPQQPQQQQHTSSSSVAAPQPYRLTVTGPGGMVHFDLSRPVESQHPAAKAGRRRRVPPGGEPVADRPEGRGSNGRVLRTLHPAAWVGHVGPAELLLLEKPWEEVLAELPPPLFTHRYGQ